MSCFLLTFVVLVLSADTGTRGGFGFGTGTWRSSLASVVFMFGRLLAFVVIGYMLFADPDTRGEFGFGTGTCRSSLFIVVLCPVCYLPLILVWIFFAFPGTKKGFHLTLLLADQVKVSWCYLRWSPLLLLFAGSEMQYRHLDCLWLLNINQRKLTDQVTV